MSFTINGQGGGGSLQDLIAQYGQAANAANTAGQQQYQNLLGSVANTTNSILGKHGLLNSAGQQAIYDTKQATKNEVGQANQSLVDRGLFNTTIAPNLISGIQNRGQQSLNNINEQVAGQKAGYTMDLGKLNADSILSRQNQAPDMGMYMQLIQRLAQSQPQHQTMTSTMGSINAANQPIQFSNFGQPTAPTAPAPQTGGYYSASGSTGSPAYYGGLEHPGDHFFGGI